jgi:glucosylceramidase
MPYQKSRREFLKLSATGVAASAVNAFAFDVSPRGEISRWVTSGASRCSAASTLHWQPASAVPGSDAILLDPDRKYQEILGFGGAFTDAACYMFNQLPALAREELFHDMFHPSQLNLNVCRTCIGSSDYSTKVYSYDEGEPDPQLQRFSIEQDREYVLPMLRQARQVNPELFLFSSPWSPPGWMKSSNSMLGGAIWRRYLKNYAQYFVKFLQAYAAEGVPVQAVTPQNEVDTDQDGRMPACIWPQEYEIEFVRDHLGPALQSSGLATKIWILDHNYNLWGRAICELDDPGLRKFCNAIAWHGYVGGPEMINKVRDAYPAVDMHWTEGGPDYTSPDYLTDWAKWGHIFTATLRNWCRSITAWNLALDEQGRPNIGPFPCGGVVTIHSQTKEIKRSGQFWGMAHFSRFVRRGARRIDSQCASSDLDHVAFQNADGQYVVVVTNPGPARSASLRLGKSQAEVSLEPDSLNTFSWSG